MMPPALYLPWKFAFWKRDGMCQEVAHCLLPSKMMWWFFTSQVIAPESLPFRKREPYSSCKILLSLSPPILTSLYSIYMASSQGKSKPSWRTHSLNPFKHKSQDQVQSNHVDESSQSLPVNAVYYPNWQVYKGLPPSSLNLRYVTHVFYAFAWWVSPSRLSEYC